MHLALIDQSYRTPKLADNLRQCLPATHTLYVWPDVPSIANIHYAITWQPPQNGFEQLPNLKAIFCLGAGVDGLIMQPNLLPRHVPLVRYVDNNLAQGMAEYALYHVLHYHRHFGAYAYQQTLNHWQQLLQRPAYKVRVGVMGLGEMGMAIIKALQPLGYQLFGFSQSAKNVNGVQSFTNLPEFLPQIDILINVLPLTPATQGILNKHNLAQLPQGASIINMGRGGHHVLQDIIDLLDTGHLAGATLDVFAEEPLPKNNAAWLHPKINVTPHIASISHMDNIVAYILQQIKNFENGGQLDNVVDVVQGY
jgi:glyoxylate/hydroxypyruvate reductase